MGKKKSNITITLKKDGAEDITVTCPEKIKLGIWQTLMELKYGLPPLNIKPVDYKGLGIIIGLFALIFIVPTILEGSEPSILIVLLIAVIVVNLIVTKNYYFAFIQKKIKAGYQPDGEENKNILQKAGITGIYSDGSEKERTTFVGSQKKNEGDALEKLEKLKKLHTMNALSDEEFEKEKQKILATL